MLSRDEQVEGGLLWTGSLLKLLIHLFFNVCHFVFSWFAVKNIHLDLILNYSLLCPIFDILLYFLDISFSHLLMKYIVKMPLNLFSHVF